MKTALKFLVTVPVAALLLTGCNVTLPGAIVKPGTKVVSTKAATGNVRLSFAGLGSAYKVLATKNDVYSVTITLNNDRGGKPQTRELGFKELHKEGAYVDFKDVPAGYVWMDVTAFDKAKKQIGFGNNGANVAVGKTTQLHVSVQLEAEVGNGKVEGVITFEETTQPATPPRDAAEVFRAADKNGDRRLSLDEYRSTWNGYPGDVTPMAAEPGVAANDAMIAPMPPIACLAADMPMEGNRLADQAIRFPCEPVDYVAQSFYSLDANGDGFLSLDEFRSNRDGVIAYPIEQPIPMID
jgi:hypothetical protein